MTICFKIITSKPDIIEKRLEIVAKGMNEHGGTKPKDGKPTIQLVSAYVDRKGNDLFFHMSYALPVPMSPVKKVLGNRLKQFKKFDRNIKIEEFEVVVEEDEEDE
jgi:hypothetical protein